MKLKAVIDSLDEVDAKYQDLYVAFDDAGNERYKLDIDGVPNHPEAQALKNAHERTKGRVRELTTEVASLKDKVEQLPDDFDPDLYERAVTEGVGGSGGKIKNEDEIRREAAEAATARSDAKWKKELDKSNGLAGRLKARVERDEKNKALDAALDAEGVTDPAYKKAARAMLAASVKVVEHDDDYEALATDPDLGDIPVAEYVKTWAQTEDGKAFVGARKSAGGGANGSDQSENPRTTTSKNPWKSDSFNMTQQMLMKKENPTLAEKLMREAGVVR